MTTNDTPPTHEESLGYIVEKKLDALLEDSEAIGAKLRESNRRYEREFRAPDPLPMRRTNLLFWVLIFATFAFLSGSVFQASRAGAQSGRQAVCVEKLSSLADPGTMSRTTARRKAVKICRGLETMAPAFFRAITR